MSYKSRRNVYAGMFSLYGIGCGIGFAFSVTAGIVVAIAGVVIISIVGTLLRRGGAAGAPGAGGRERNRNRRA